MLLGIWKNVEDLEESLNLKELETVVRAAREKEHRKNKFLAAINGIDLDANDKHKDKFEEIKRRVEARTTGVSEEQLALRDLGIEIETE